MLEYCFLIGSKMEGCNALVFENEAVNRHFIKPELKRTMYIVEF